VLLDAVVISKGSHISQWERKKVGKRGGHEEGEKESVCAMPLKIKSDSSIIFLGPLKRGERCKKGKMRCS